MKLRIRTTANQNYSAFLYYKSNESSSGTFHSLDIQGLSADEMNQIENSISSNDTDLNLVKHCLDY